MTSDYWLSFAVGFFGSMHCVGMCGAIVIAYSTQQGKIKHSGLYRFSSHLIYNSGRILSYTLLGAILGFVGGSFSILKTTGYWFSIVLGVLLVIGGFVMLNLIPLWKWDTAMEMADNSKNILMRLYRYIYRQLIASPSLESRFYIGCMTPLLPCGLLYSMLVKASGSSGPIEGAQTMFAFGLGIVPALFLTGMASSFLSVGLRKYANHLASITIIMMGLVMILRALGVIMPVEGHHHVH